MNVNRRHYSNLRFAVLSVYFAVLGGLSSVAFGIVEIKSPSPRIILAAKIAGFLFTLVFFSFEILCDLSIHCRYKFVSSGVKLALKVSGASEREANNVGKYAGAYAAYFAALITADPIGAVGVAIDVGTK